MVSGRLIDVDKLIEDLKEYVENIKNIRDDGKCFLTEENVLSIIKEQPTAYDIDKVIEELEKLADELEEKALTMNKAECFDFANGLLSKAIGVRDAIDIIKEGGLDES